MSLDPVEFTFGKDDSLLTLRYHPLAAVPLAREHHKLLMRFDMESGALDTLAFTFSEADFASMMTSSVGGLFKLTKALSMLLAPKPLAGLEPDTDGGEDEAPRGSGDEIPYELADLCLYFARLGKVELKTSVGGGARWVDMQTEGDFDGVPPMLIYVVAWRVLESIFIPFVDLLRGLSDKAKGQSSGNDSASSEPQPAEELEAPTSETPSST